jgi:hypothetical protein
MNATTDKPKLATLIIFPELQIAVCDTEGKQVAELQQTFLELWAQHAEQLGYEPNGIEIITRAGVKRLVKHEYGWRAESVPQAPHSGGVVIAPGGPQQGPATTPPPLSDLDVIDAMEKYGGSFVKALAETARRADPINLRRVKAAWPEYWNQYVHMASAPPPEPQQ